VVRLVLRNTVESRSFARKTIEYEHARIHEGHGWDCDIEFTLIGTTPNYYHIRTGEYEIHLKDIVITTNKPEIKLYLYKNPTVTLNGSPTQPTIFNSDDDETTTCSMRIYTNSTVVSEGTKRKTYYLSGSTGQGHSSAGEASAYGVWEYILNPNTDYLIKIVRIVADGDTTGVFKIRFYEEEENWE
jgi:hypothetical protein